ncbi:MAG: aminotransferase class III-fold pyridoxal phosphate-dependent enzyme, partial [Tepidimonas taiwanensis]|nr:aminotransferase class III-fold pyridoxal phosphate-dependent enzyme [Tepidimonas taiwanensis]
VMFTASGSEAADTALKIARAYWRLRGQGSKTRLIGRAKGYHGVNFGGISVGGIAGNRKTFGPTLEVDHLPHTQPPAGSFFRGQPPADGGGRYPGAALAEELLRLIELHDASTIAAVIVEPFSGSAGGGGPPVGYLQRLREICTQHDILLIFDEVITGFGRCGAWTAAEALGVTPDLLTFAKQVTNGVQPLGGVAVRRELYEAFMAAGGPDYALELAHGYTYSAHPVACAAALASLQLLQQDEALARVRALAPVFEAKVHALRGVSPHLLDIRNYGLAAGLTLAAAPGEPLKRPFELAMRLWRQGFYVRYGGDTVQLAPPFISTEAELDRLIDALGEALRGLP